MGIADSIRQSARAAPATRGSVHATDSTRAMQTAKLFSKERRSCSGERPLAKRSLVSADFSAFQSTPAVSDAWHALQPGVVSGVPELRGA